MDPTEHPSPASAVHPPPPGDPYGPEWVIGPRPVETAQDFRQGFHTRAYLEWRYRMSGLDIERLPNDHSLAAMRAANYNDWTKFILHLPLWHDLSRAMPRGYAEFLGVREDILQAAAEQDRADARRAMELPSCPRMFGGFQYFGNVKFPPECQNEQDCLAHLVAFSRKNRVGSVFNVSGLKKYRVYPRAGGIEAELACYEFHVRYRRKQIEFTSEEHVTKLPV